MNFKGPYVATFLCFSSTIYLLAAYSFVKKDLIEKFGITKTEMGVIDGIMPIGSIIGIIIYILTPRMKEQPMKFYTLCSVGYTVAFLLIIWVPEQVTASLNSVTLYLASFLIGFFRSALWPFVLSMIAYHKENNENEQGSVSRSKCIITVWSNGYQVGVIIGFLLSNILFYNLELAWESCILFGAVLNISVTALTYFYLQEYMDNQNSVKKNGCQQQLLISMGELVQVFLQRPINFVFTLSFITLKVVFLLSILTLPTFLFSIGFEGNEGLISTAFTSCVVLGTILFALIEYLTNKLFGQNEDSEKEDQKGRESSDLAYSTSFSLVCLVASITGALIYTFISHNQESANTVIWLILVSMIGMFLGGPLNSNSSHIMLGILEDIKVRKKPEDEETGHRAAAGSKSWFKINKDAALMGFFQLANYILTMPFLVLSFLVMDKFNDYFFAVILGLTVVCLGADLTRILMSSKERKRTDTDFQGEGEYQLVNQEN